MALSACVSARPRRRRGPSTARGNAGQRRVGFVSGASAATQRKLARSSLLRRRDIGRTSPARTSSPPRHPPCRLGGAQPEKGTPHGARGSGPGSPRGTSRLGQHPVARPASDAESSATFSAGSRATWARLLEVSSPIFSMCSRCPRARANIFSTSSCSAADARTAQHAAPVRGRSLRRL